MNAWDQWKKGFEAWENATAGLTEQWLRSPLLLTPAGNLLGAAMKAKAKADRTAATWWSTVGLPTRRDQERTLYAIQQLHSRISDLEEQLAEARVQVVATGEAAGRKGRKA